MLIFAVHPGLAAAGRLPRLTGADRAPNAAELLTLLACGVGATLLSAYVHLDLRVPGSAILRPVLPMALGLALVPRHGAGTSMGVVAGLSMGLLRVFGLAHTGVGALTSLLALGPLLDLAIFGVRSGWRLYAGFMMAGVAANLAALIVRGGFKALVPFVPEGRPLADWILQAPLTYPLCGALAGLLSAVAWFRLRRRADRENPG